MFFARKRKLLRPRLAAVCARVRGEESQERECVCVRETAKERERARAAVCARARGEESQERVCVCKRERAKERERASSLLRPRLALVCVPPTRIVSSPLASQVSYKSTLLRRNTPPAYPLAAPK